MRIILSTLLIVMFSLNTFSQETYPYNGVRPKDVTCEAYTHANIFVDYKTKITDATLIVRNGKVESCGQGVRIPEDAVVYDLKGKFIFPAFIDLYSDYGMPKSEPTQRNWRQEKFDSDRKGAFGWNGAIRSDINASSIFSSNTDAAKEFRGLGFGAVLTHQMDGIARGSSALVALGSNNNFSLIMAEAAAYYSFNKGSSTQDYPSSLMGSIALLRQTYYDAQWYQTAGVKEERNISLEAFNAIQTLPQLFDAGDKWNVFRADEVGDEFNTQYIIKTNGNEYQRLADIKATKALLIVPVNFPAAYDVSDPYASRMVSLEEMKHWEMAPSNAAMLAKEGIEFCFTSSGLNDKKDFLPNIRKAIARGLSKEYALKALTHNPAKFIKAENEVGSLKQGTQANFFISDKEVFEEGAVIYESWVQGEQLVLEDAATLNLAGTYKLSLPKTKYDITVTGTSGKHKAETQLIKTKKQEDGTSKQDTSKVEIKLTQAGQSINLNFEPTDSIYFGIVRLSGEIQANKNWRGEGQTSTGEWFNWTSTYAAADSTKADEKDKKPKDSPAIGAVTFPFTAYGWAEKPKAETVLIKNATLWTCEAEGKIENGQLLISNGKIIAVGKTVDASKYPGAKIMDAKGMHVSPGIIDEHSHIALESVNEGAQTCSAEVEEQRVVWPEDINIYRQLSGGVTAAQLLHGSANAIGGQSAIVKMHWGGNAADMLIDNADGFIKFALGENVKHSAWGNDGRERFPQTRMGVEQVYYDHFIRAREYGAEWNRFTTSILKNTSDRKGVKGAVPNAPRRDLELETLDEILNKQRFVTCHSYVQSEINMLMHVADSMGFTLNTFTHILEGYKVADKMKAHGAGASSFSDWWAYKWEVKDAIPYNGALLWENGVTVAFNSDDAEMARRLNQEAAKAVKYGNVPEEEALKFVTLNPAKLLHLDERTGSLKAGKDADVVIWNNNPLSIYAIAQQTYVDGICYYDINRSAQLEKQIETERARLIQKMLNAKSAGEPTQPPTHKHEKHFHCETMDESSKGVFIH